MSVCVVVSRFVGWLVDCFVVVSLFVCVACVTVGC